MGRSRDPLATGRVLWVQPWLLGQQVMPKAWAGAVPVLSCCASPPELLAHSCCPGQGWRGATLPTITASPPEGFATGLHLCWDFSSPEHKPGWAAPSGATLAPALGLLGCAWQQKASEEPRCEAQSSCSAVRCSELCMLGVISILMSSHEAIEETNTRPTAKRDFETFFCASLSQLSRLQFPQEGEGQTP